MSTEHDLRGALRSLVPDDLDATDFRARFDRLVDDAQAGPDGTDVDIVPIAAAVPLRRRWAARTGIVVTAAACAAAVVAIAIAVVTGGGHRGTPPAKRPGAPAAVRAMLLPGTVILHNYSGRGARTFDVATVPVPADFEYDAYFTCRGGGTLRIGDGIYYGTCGTGGGAAGGSNPLKRGQLIIRASAAATWHVTLALAPEAETNGSLQSPVDDDMTGAGNEVRQDGRGSAVATFRGASTDRPSDGRYRVRLVCHGLGVTIPGLRARSANGLTTRTCFAGHEYVWDSVRVPVSGRVRVVAAPGTTWTVAID